MLLVREIVEVIRFFIMFRVEGFQVDVIGVEVFITFIYILYS